MIYLTPNNKKSAPYVNNVKGSLEYLNNLYGIYKNMTTYNFDDWMLGFAKKIDNKYNRSFRSENQKKYWIY